MLAWERAEIFWVTQTISIKFTNQVDNLQVGQDRQQFAFFELLRCFIRHFGEHLVKVIQRFLDDIVSIQSNQRIRIRLFILDLINLQHLREYLSDHRIMLFTDQPRSHRNPAFDLYRIIVFEMKLNNFEKDIKLTSRPLYLSFDDLLN